MFFGAEFSLRTSLAFRTRSPSRTLTAGTSRAGGRLGSRHGIKEGLAV